MREVVAVCRSTKRSRDRVAGVLDRYLWRIGDRTWRGRASNACLDRMARELRRQAKRNTAVVIHEMRSTRESRVPIVRIGASRAFSPEGLVPVSTRLASSLRWPPRTERERHALAILRIAVLLHDLGKATKLFQAKLRRSLKSGAKPEADPVRHELFSAAVWDVLTCNRADEEVVELLRVLQPEDVDSACLKAVEILRRIHASPRTSIGFSFEMREGTIGHSIGMMILTHHRLPDAKSDHTTLEPSHHVNASELDPRMLEIAAGPAFWHDPRWQSALRRATDDLRPNAGTPGLDLALRASLMFADHLGSALKQARDPAAVPANEHLGNTLNGRPADALALHVERVVERVPGCFDMLHRHRERYPALGAEQVPLGLMHPEPASEPFGWQATTAAAASDLCQTEEGGFFACLLAGTGTGKTRGAPTIMAAAAFADARAERRYLRMTLALGLLSLASQAARDYVDDLGFDPADIAVLVGQPPLQFGGAKDTDALPGDGEPQDGSESALVLPNWLRVERASGGVPSEGDLRELDWLRRLSWDTDRGLPATLDLIIEHAGTRGADARRMIATPVVVGTVDHLMGVASPAGARFLFPSLRVLTSDLILDEIDQYDPEDLASIARLVFQTAVGGRRVIVMSATLTEDVAAALYQAYRAGWREYAVATSAVDHVHVLCAGDAAGSCFTSAGGQDFAAVFERCRERVLAALEASVPRRRGLILPPCDGWAELVDQVDGAISDLHDTNASEIGGLRVSIGFVRMTRIRHAVALAVQMKAGAREGRLRLKLCLHSQFPRLHRAYIESELKKALTRKAPNPDAGLLALCEQERVFQRAHAAGCEDVEIVVVTSPVIETGNDLDFDWAIIDPISLRAVVQAAGRVWRHRKKTVYGAPNVALLGRSPIAMVNGNGRLAMPGVETKPNDDTMVARVSSLEPYEGRHFRDLAGRETFDVIDAGAVLRTGGHVPLREAEAQLRMAMISTANDKSPLGCYIAHPTARMNRRIARSRMFRRDTTRDLLYTLEGEVPDTAKWMVDLAPGTSQSRPVPASDLGLQLADSVEHLLIQDLAVAAWATYQAGRTTLTASDLRSLMSVRVPDYAGGSGNLTEPTVTYSEGTGFTHGYPDDLLAPFGKRQLPQ